MLGKSPSVAWYEKRSARDPDIPERVLNGFTSLRLDGADLKEIFYDENGGIAWSPDAPMPRIRGDGRRFRILGVIDDFSRECLATVEAAPR